MRVVDLLAMAAGLVIAAIGLVGIAAPSLLLELGRFLQTTNALYIVAAVRVFFGAVLLLAAPGSRTPRTLRVLGVLIIVTGVITPFVGVERTRAMLDWWSTQGALFTRAWAMAAVAFGLCIVYAVTSPRRTAV